MAISIFERRDDELMVDINTTPLIDVMLVLLIMLIITIPVQTHAVKLDMPRDNPPPTTAPPPVVDLLIDFDGTITWNGAPVPDRETLENDLQTAARQDPQPEIHIRGDSNVRYQFVGQVLVATQQIGIRKVAFITTPDHFGPGT